MVIMLSIGRQGVIPGTRRVERGKEIWHRLIHMCLQDPNGKKRRPNANTRIRFLGDRAASHLPTNYGNWGNTVCSPNSSKAKLSHKCILAIQKPRKCLQLYRAAKKIPVFFVAQQQSLSSPLRINITVLYTLAVRCQIKSTTDTTKSCEYFSPYGYIILTSAKETILLLQLVGLSDQTYVTVLLVIWKS